MTTAKSKLGEVITFHLKKRNLTDRDISARVGASIRDVERWKTGELVPDRFQWKKLASMAARDLWSHQQLHGDAMREQEAERDAVVRSLQRNGHQQKTAAGVVVTNFGDKLVAARVVVEPSSSSEPIDPPPTGEPQKATPSPQPQSYVDRANSAAARSEFAKSIIAQRPKIPARGPDGLIELVRKEFGIGISDGEVKRLKEAVYRDGIERQLRQQITDGGVPKSSARPQTATEPATRPVNDSDVSAGVELIIGAIPGLQEMSIKIDDQGVASVSYSVRQVQVTTVSTQLTVRR